MSVSTKINALEKKLLHKGHCTTCGGAGWAAYAFETPGGKIGKPHGACPECGTARGIKLFGTDSRDADVVPEWVAGV